MDDIELRIICIEKALCLLEHAHDSIPHDSLQLINAAGVIYDWVKVLEGLTTLWDGDNDETSENQGG